MRQNSAKVIEIRNGNAADGLKLIEDSFRELKIPDAESKIAQLLAEECIARMSMHCESISLSVKKGFGAAHVMLVSKGREYDPLRYGPEDGQEEDYGYKILDYYREKLRYIRNGRGENTVLIKMEYANSRELLFAAMALILGAIAGQLMRTFLDAGTAQWINENILNMLRNIFINTMMIAVAPMVFFSVVSGMTSISDKATLGSMGYKLILFSFMKLAFFVVAGLGTGYLIGGIPQLLQIITDAGSPLHSTAFSIKDFIIDIVPGNMITPFSSNNILQGLFLACITGVLINRMGNKARWAREGIEFMCSFTIDIIGIFRPLIPMIVAVSTTEIVMQAGLKGLLSYGKLIAASAMGLPLCFIVSGLLIMVFCRLSPLPYIRKAAVFSLLPFALANSSACLPDVIKFCKEKLGMEETYTKFAIPVGMQLNKDGNAFYVCVTSMVLARTFHISMDMDFFISLFFVEFFISLFFVEFFMALTGIGLLIMSPVLSAMGIPESAVLLFIGIEPVMDMFGTAQSVLGNITSAFICAKRSGNVNEQGYYKRI